MKTLALRSQFNFPRNTKSTQNLPKSTPLKPPSFSTAHVTRPSGKGHSPECPGLPKRAFHPKFTRINSSREPTGQIPPKTQMKNQFEVGGSGDSPKGYRSSSSWSVMITGAISIVAVLLMLGLDDHKALALGPEGPSVEEFWENVRRYALYALTVSTGAIYTGVQPIIELLKNPITAILIITIIAGTIYIVSQVLSLMVGVSDFSYEYGY